MFEFHGWVTINEGWCEAQDDDALLEDNVKRIRELAESLSETEFGCKADVAVTNGQYSLRLHGFRNHHQRWVLDLFTRAGQIAQGSYGLLYIMDDESPEYDNEFQVWVMKRGCVKKAKDELLSPCIPELEE